MALYDIIDDITNRQMQKTETGDNRVFGLMIGVVVKNYDRSMPGRVCVEIPVRDTDANTVKWAKLVTNSAGRSWGTYFLPEVGDQVVLGFEGGNFEKPYILGCLALDNNKVFNESSDENNQYKVIRSRHGSNIRFVDNKEGDGEKDQIQIQTAKAEHTMLLDNENHYMRLTDKKKKNMIEMETENGNTTIKVEKRLVIKVGNNISLTMDAETGAVTLKCEKLNAESTNSVKIKSDGNFRIDGGSLSIQASSSLKAESSGTAQFKGASVQLG